MLSLYQPLVVNRSCPAVSWLPAFRNPVPVDKLVAGAVLVAATAVLLFQIAAPSEYRYRTRLPSGWNTAKDGWPCVCVLHTGVFDLL